MGQLHTTRHMIGLDLFHPPEQLGEGMLTQADNVLITGGDATLRPGLVGQFGTPLGNPLYAPFEYLDGGTTKILFVSGGNLYKTSAGSSSYTLMSLTGVAAGSINGPGARWARLGKYAYLVDGVGPMLRVDLTGGTTLTALTVPTDAPVVALASAPLDTLSTAAHWAADTLSGSTSNQVVNGTFSGGSGSNSYSAATIEPGWTNDGASVDWHDNAGPGSNGVPGGNSGTWLLADTPGDAIQTTAAITNYTETLDTARYSSQFYLAYDALNADTGGRGSILATIIALDSGGSEIARLTTETDVPYNGNQKVTFANVYNFGETSSTIASYKIRLENGDENQNGDNSIYIYNIVSRPLTPGVTFSTSASGIVIHVSKVLPNVQRMFLNGVHLRYSFGATKDLTSANLLSFVVSNFPADLTFHLRLHQASSTIWENTNEVTIENGHATVDISTCTSATRSACDMFEIVFTADVALPASGQFGIGPLTAAGNLSVGRADYAWTVTEMDALDDPTFANVLESNPGPFSNALTPTTTQAQATLTLPMPVNTLETTHLKVWRRGGVFSDGVARLIGIVSLNSPYAITDGDGTLVTWNHSTRTFTDNTPDLFLIDADTLVTGRDAPRAGATAIAAWQGRICLLQGGQLWISWLIEQEAQAALYFTEANDPNDPLAAVKGATFSIGIDDDDPGIALVALGTNAFLTKGFLVVLKGRSVWLLSGFTPADFALQSYLTNSGIGCVAGRAACLVDNLVWFLGADGVYRFNGDRADNASLLIDPGLNVPGFAPASCAMFYHDRRLILLTPAQGASVNSLAWVFDTRQNGWTRWTNMHFTGGVTLSTQADRNDCYLAGTDTTGHGQLYKLDFTATTDGGSAIPFAVTSRGFGQEVESLDYWRLGRALRVYAQIQTTADITPTVALSNESAVLWSQGYTYPAGQNGPVLRVPQPALGEYHTLGISGSATAPLRIKALAVESEETKGAK